MKTIIYKGKEISHRNFITMLHFAGIDGGNKLTYYQSLQKQADKGNEKAIDIINNLQFIKQ